MPDLSDYFTLYCTFHLQTTVPINLAPATANSTPNLSNSPCSSWCEAHRKQATQSEKLCLRIFTSTWSSQHYGGIMGQRQSWNPISLATNTVLLNPLLYLLWVAPLYTVLKQIHLIHWASKGFVDSKGESLFKHVINQIPHHVYAQRC